MAGGKRSRLEWVRSVANEVCVLLELRVECPGRKASRVLLTWGGTRWWLGVVWQGLGGELLEW